ncbi:hypothetical protein C8Q75DRAFT_729937 [Abortiporus biennis]|nr:hypothetical protein C8Q75DRAFT_729937 [Abortiporus biennis]
MAPQSLYYPDIDKGIYHRMSGLTAISLVSKLWLSAANSYLYETPLLTSPDRIQQFARTLKAVPELRHRVKDILVLNHIADNGRFVLYPRLVASRARASLLWVSRHCHALKAISFHSGPFARLPLVQMSHLLTPESAYNSSLTRLTIFGKIHPFPTAKELTASGRPVVILPCLEVFCLRSLEIPIDFQIPSFPNMRVLQIVQCIIPNDVSNLFPPNHQLPKLQSLELYENRLPLGPVLSDVLHVDPSNMRTITKAILIGPLELGGSHLPLMLANIKDITLGGGWLEVYCDIELWKFHPSLESLAIVFPVGHVDAHATVDEEILMHIHNCLSSQYRLRSLKRLIFRFDLDDFQLLGVDIELALRDFQTFCATRGIELLVQSSSQYINKWLTSRVFDSTLSEME